MRYLLIAALLSLSACASGEVRETLGLDRNAPDEFRVVSRPPLSVPPEFTLRPPSAGEDEPVGVSSGDMVHGMVTGTTAYGDSPNTLPTSDTAVAPVSAAPLESGSESQFLSKIGSDQADPSIREKIHEDRSVQKKEEEESWMGDLNPFSKDKESIDAAAEAKALRDKQVKSTGAEAGGDVKEAAPAEEKKEEKVEEKTEEKKEEKKTE